MGLKKPSIENAKILYKNVHEVKNEWGDDIGKNVIVRGIKHKYGIYGACLYYGAQFQNNYVKVDNISRVMQLDEFVIKEGCKRVNELLPTNVMLNYVKPVISNDLVTEYIRKFELTPVQEMEICTLSSNIDSLEIATNHQPNSLACTTFIFYKDISELSLPLISKKMILSTFDVTEVTVDRIYAKLYPFRNSLLSTEKTMIIRNRLIELEYIVENETSF